MLTHVFSLVTGSLSTSIGNHLLPSLKHSSFMKWIVAICDSPCGTGERTLPASSSVYHKIMVGKVLYEAMPVVVTIREVRVSWHVFLCSSFSHGTGQIFLDLKHYPYDMPTHLSVAPFVVKPIPAVICSLTGPGQILFSLLSLSSSCRLEPRFVGHMPCR